MNDLYNDILKLCEQLDISVRALRKTGYEYGEAHSNARMLLSQELLKLEAEGRPVTNLYYIARGKDHVAKAKEKQLEREYSDIQSE